MNFKFRIWRWFGNSLILNRLKMRHRIIIALNILLGSVLFFSVRYLGDSGTAVEVPYTQSLKSSTDVETLHLKAEIARLKKANARCGCQYSPDRTNLPTIYAITPTHTRPVQKAELTRLSQTFMLVPNFHWIVVEDSEQKTKLVSDLLAKSGLQYTHINAATPREWKLQLEQPQWQKPRGVIQRNAALDWIRKHVTANDKGVVYFADDDNVYSLDLFEEMRDTKKASVWPVGLAGGLMVERPIVNKEGKVSEWFTLWRPERPFAIDMAGFCINVQLFLNNPKAVFSWEVPRGYQESAILSAVVSKEDLEPKADNCKKVLVWHTRTENPKMTQEDKLKEEGKLPSNQNIEV